VQTNLAALQQAKDFPANVLAALSLLDGERETRQSKTKQTAEARLYDGFIAATDATASAALRAAEPHDIAVISQDFRDLRLREIAPLYKARNFSKQLTDDERTAWEAYRYEQLMTGGAGSRLAKFMHRLGQLAPTTSDPEKQFLLEELQLYAESIMPVQEL